MILALHILGAIGFAGAGIGVLVNKSPKKLMRGFVVFEFVTGTILSITSGSTLVAYCAKMGIYLAFWMGVEFFSARKIFRSQAEEQTRG